MAQRDRRREGFDAGLHRRSFLRSARRKLLAIGLLVAFVEMLGVPQVRLRSSGRGQRAAYVGLGAVDETARGRAGVEPLVRLVPLQRSVFAHAREGAARIKARVDAEFGIRLKDER